MVLPTADGRILKIRKATTPEPVHKEIYATLNIPTEVMKPLPQTMLCELQAARSGRCLLLRRSCGHTVHRLTILLQPGRELLLLLAT